MKALSCCLILFLLGAAGASAQQDSQQTPPKATKAKTNPDGATDEEMVDSGLSLELFYWVAPFHPSLKGGHEFTGTYPSDLDYPGTDKGTPGAELSIPAGTHHVVTVSYFRTQGQGNTIATENLTIFNNDYAPGDYLSVAYTLTNIKASYDFLTWPYPMTRSKWRLKTLWEVEYVNMKSAVDAPLKTDSSGNLVAASGTATHSFFYPSFGVGLERRLAKNLRWVSKASGFAIPHYPVVWDAETRLAYRRGHLEVIGGARAFHFQTSSNHADYTHGTLYGGFAGIAWYFSY